MSGNRRVAASLTGLAIAWGGIALLISPAARSLADPAKLGTALVGQLFLWALAAVVVAIVLLWEKQPLASLWLKRFRWQSIGWALLLLVSYYAVLFPLGEWVRDAAGLSGFSQGMDAIMRYPLSYRIFAVVTAGIVEEALLRGYTITRLIALTGRVWLAAALAVSAFAVIHVPVWGWGFALIGLIGGVVTTAFFVWKKDLLALIVFHTITDAVGIVIAPTFSKWWKELPPT
jgi:membrane protease YdiL (CAAX protease family)